MAQRVFVQIVLLEMRAWLGPARDRVLQMRGQVCLRGQAAVLEQIAAQHTCQPARMHKHVGHIATVGLDRHPIAVAVQIFAVGDHRQVKRNEQRLATQQMCAAYDIVGQFLVAPEIQLEPLCAPGRHDILDIHRARAGNGERHPRRRRRTR